MLRNFVDLVSGHLVQFYLLACVGLVIADMYLRGFCDRKMIIVDKSTYLTWYRKASAEGKTVEHWLIEIIGIENPSESSGGESP